MSQEKRQLPSRSKIFLAMVLCGTAMWFVCDHVRISPTTSVGHRLFVGRRIQVAEKLTHEDYVSFDHLVPGGKTIRELKKIGCLPGEHLEVTSESTPDYYCGGAYLGRGRVRSPSGIPLTPFRYNGTVPPGSYFVVGSNGLSYDSRYYGFIEDSLFKEKLWPIL